MNWKRWLIGGGILGLGYYIYNGVKQLESGGLIVGNLKFAGFEGLKLRLQVPISNISTLPVTFKGFTSTIYMTVNGSEQVVGYANITDQRKTMLPNTSYTFTVLFNPSFSIATQLIDLVRTRSFSTLKAKCDYVVTSTLTTIKGKVDII